jgi:adenylate cyclase
MNRNEGQRRLSAILIADIAGYTRLVEQDTDGTVAAWKAARDDVIEPESSRHGGRLVKLTGDGFLAEFPSIQDAVKCAIDVQTRLSDRHLRFRMGIHLGDVIDDGKDIHGEGVNIAARIEALAEPGGVCVSATVHEQVRSRVQASFEYMGEHEVKHVSAPVRVYRIELTSPASSASGTEDVRRAEKPSVAVLPFDNMSGDADQEYFSDGVTEDIITALSRFRSFFVTARNSTFSYKGE